MKPRRLPTPSARLAWIFAAAVFAFASRSLSQTARPVASRTGGLAGIAEVCRKGASSAPGAVAESLRKAGFTPVVLCRTAKPDDLDAIVSKLDLLVLPGGEDVDPARYGERPSPALGAVNKVRDAFEEEVLRSAVRFEVPVIGFCRGEQRLNVFFGGTLVQDLPSERGKAYTVEHRRRSKNETRHNIAIAGGSRLAGACGVSTAVVNSSHHQAVKGLAPGLTVTARSEDGVVEAVECDWYPAAAVQFHPERLCADEVDPVWERFFANALAFAGPKATLPVARRPIGVFSSDPGVAGLLRRLRSLDVLDNATGARKPDGIPDFVREDFVYLHDAANAPYAGYVAAGNTAFLRELAVRGVQFLLGTKGHDPAKLVVVADADASVAAADALRSMPRPRDARVIHAADAVAGEVCEALKAETKPYALAVLAPCGTGSAEGFCRAFENAAAVQDLAVRPKILSAAQTGPDPRKAVRDLVEAYCSQGGTAPIKGVIFDGAVYAEEEVRRAFDALAVRSGLSPAVPAGIPVFDASACIAAACYRALLSDGFLSPAKENAAESQGFVTVGKKGFVDERVKFGRAPLGHDTGTRVEPVPGASAR